MQLNILETCGALSRGVNRVGQPQIKKIHIYPLTCSAAHPSRLLGVSCRVLEMLAAELSAFF